MADSIPILWPPDISVTAVSPLAILRAQVAPLQKLTHGLLRVNLSTTLSEESAQVVHRMDLIAPGLNDDRHQILSVTHSKDRVYPARIEAQCFEPKPEPGDFLPAKGGQKILKGFPGVPPDWRPSADSEGAFIKYLTKVLNSQEVRSVIDSLLARMNEQESVAASKPPER